MAVKLHNISEYKAKKKFLPPKQIMQLFPVFFGQQSSTSVDMVNKSIITWT